jgi:GNAT superfamily N-acetyltransferase
MPAVDRAVRQQAPFTHGATLGRDALVAGVQPAHRAVDAVATPHGVLRTRPELDADVSFLFGLFESVKGPEMAAMPVDAGLQRQLLEMQFRALTQGYRTAYPAAAFLVVLLDETPIGRLIVDADPDRWLVVYVALTAPWRRRGIGVALMKAALAEPMRLGAVCQARVALDNLASLRLWRRVGFEARESTATDVVLEWRPTAR